MQFAPIVTVIVTGLVTLLFEFRQLFENISINSSSYKTTVKAQLPQK